MKPDPGGSRRACWWGLGAGMLLARALVSAEVPAVRGSPTEASPPSLLPPGDHTRALTVAGRNRSFLVHVPPEVSASRPMPVVLVLHGAGTNARMTVAFTGLNAKADASGFAAVYPNGTGVGDLLLTWNAGGLPESWTTGKPDDVAFIRALLDELPRLLPVDPRRVFATGLSNGGMMCYRLAAELSDRIAAIAPVAGTMTVPDPHPTRPVSVLHFHGTEDRLVPFGGSASRGLRGIRLASVDDSIQAWRRINGCPDLPVVSEEPDRAADGTRVRRKTYSPGKDGTEVVLIEIEGGGHTWPGQKPPVGFLGRSTLDVSANDLLWEFFCKHPLPEKAPR